MEPMTPVLDVNPMELPEHLIAKDQPQYLPLPAIITSDGVVTCRWRLTWRERFTILWRGSFWMQTWTFGHPLQPMRPRIEHPEFGWTPATEP